MLDIDLVGTNLDMLAAILASIVDFKALDSLHMHKEWASPASLDSISRIDLVHTVGFGPTDFEDHT